MKRVFATARMCLIESSYSGLSNLPIQYLLRIASIGSLLMIWRALSMQGADMGGLTLNQLYVYTLLGTALAPMLDVRTPLTDWLGDGSILSLYHRPSTLFAQLAAHTVGGWGMQFLLFSLPTLGIAAACGVDLAPKSPWFLPSLLLTASEGFAVDYLFACLMIRLRSLEWPVYVLRGSLSALLTGALVPFSALPWGMGRFLALTPFGTLAGAPLSLYAGMDAPSAILPAQVLWNLALWPLAIWWFKKSGERMVSYGG